MPIVTDQLYAYWNSKQGVAGTTWSNIAPSSPVMNGTSTTFPTATVDGMYFDGTDDKVSFGFGSGQDTYFMSASNSWSFEMFLRIDNTAAQPDIFVQPLSGSNIIYVDSATNLYLSFLDASKTQAYSGYVSIPLTTLTQFVITYNGSTKTFKIYVGGVLKVTNVAPTVFVHGSPFIIGGNSTYVPKGIIDGIKLYKKELSLAEVQQNNTNGLAIGLSAPAPVTHLGSATLSAIASVNAASTVSTASTTHLASASLSGVAAITASARRIQSGTVSLAGVGTVSAGGRRTTYGTTSLSAIGTVASVGTNVISADTTFTGSAMVGANGITTKLGDATLASIAHVAATPTIIKSVTASLNANGAISVATDSTKLGNALLSASATLTTNGTRIVTSLASVQGSANVTAQAGIVSVGVAAVIAVGTVIATGDVRTAIQAAGAVLGGSASIMAVGSRSAIAHAILTGISALTATAGEQYRQYVAAEIVLRRRIAQGTTLSRRGHSAINVTRRTTGEVSI